MHLYNCHRSGWKREIPVRDVSMYSRVPDRIHLRQMRLSENPRRQVCVQARLQHRCHWLWSSGSGETSDCFHNQKKVPSLHQCKQVYQRQQPWWKLWSRWQTARMLLHLVDRHKSFPVYQSDRKDVLLIRRDQMQRCWSTHQFHRRFL